ncbi:MAG: metal-dependent transcriptional regulator [Promethearchaeota archaeon]
MLDLDYKVLKYLYRVSEQKVGNIAIYFKLPHSTIGSSVKRLEQEVLVKYERYQVVELTNKGKDLAIELCRHTQLLELFLYNELGLTADQAHYESEKFNLLFSCETINKICEKYNHPEKCPCGDTINSTPNCSCEEYLPEY